MARKEYIAELRTREKQIAAELDAIRQILALEGVEIEAETTIKNGKHSVVKKTKKEVFRPEGIEKGNLSWEAYWIVVLRELGGSGRTEDATKYAIKANPKIKDQNLILTSARTKLSKLYREKKIGAIKSNIRSEGYEYILPKESEPNGTEIK